MHLAAQIGITIAVSIAVSLSITAYNNSVVTTSEAHKSSASKVINNTISPIITMYNFNSTPVESAHETKSSSSSIVQHKKVSVKRATAMQTKSYNDESYICGGSKAVTSTMQSSTAVESYDELMTQNTENIVH